MPRDPRASRLVAAALAVLLVAIGAAGGVIAGRTFLAPDGHDRRRGPPAPEVVLQRMRGELELSDEQARAIAPVLEERSREMARLFDRVDPEAERIRAAANERIRASLSPAQRARFDAQIADAEQRRADARRRLRAPITGGTPASSGSAR